MEQATGLRIDHYVEIGFGGFVGAVDAVGGVEMCVPQAIKDPKAALNIKEGCQELDGATALGYVRTRATAGSDFDRVERQRAFLSALVNKATSPATLVNPFRASRSRRDDGGDHRRQQRPRLEPRRARVGDARHLGGEGVTTTVPVGGTPTLGGQSVVQWDKKRASALFTALENDERPTGRARPLTRTGHGLAGARSGDRARRRGQAGLRVRLRAAGFSSSSSAFFFVEARRAGAFFGAGSSLRLACPCRRRPAASPPRRCAAAR